MTQAGQVCGGHTRARSGPRPLSPDQTPQMHTYERKSNSGEETFKKI